MRLGCVSACKPICMAADPRAWIWLMLLASPGSMRLPDAVQEVPCIENHMLLHPQMHQQMDMQAHAM